MDPNRHNLNVLDGLRGVAACAVLIFHVSASHGQLLPHGYLAVDFFFMLSGFVMALSYQGRLDSGQWTVSRFMMARAARLYPIYVLGVLLGICFMFAQAQEGGVHRTAIQVLTATAPEFVFLPDFFATHARGDLFSLDVPLWSLFFELIAYAFYSLCLRNRSLAFLWRLLLICWIALVWQGVEHRSLDLGVDTATIVGGLCRVAFSFVAGLILHRLWRLGRMRWRVPPLIIAAVLLGSLALPFKGYLYELFVVSALYPTILLLGVYSVAQPWIRPGFVMLGRISFPLYVIHVPLLRLADRSVAHLQLTRSYLTLMVFMVPTLILGAYFLERFYDVPSRRFLMSRLLKQDRT